MVGDSQAEHAWLDEAFATYAEQLVDGTRPATGDLALPGPVDRPTADYGADAQDYYRVTYGKGAAALRAARDAAGTGGVRRSDPLLCQRQCVAHRRAVRPRKGASGLARSAPRPPNGRRAALTSARTGNPQPASATSFAMRPMPSARSSSPNA